MTFGITVPSANFWKEKGDASNASEFRRLNPYNPDLGRGLMFRPEREEPDPDREEFF